MAKYNIEVYVDVKCKHCGVLQTTLITIDKHDNTGLNMVRRTCQECAKVFYLKREVSYLLMDPVDHMSAEVMHRLKVNHCALCHMIIHQLIPIHADGRLLHPDCRKLEESGEIGMEHECEVFPE